MICYHNDICYSWDKKILCPGQQDFFLAGRIFSRVENPEKIMGGENEEKGKGKREKKK